MSDHDPLCPFTYSMDEGCAQCDLNGKVRADERERIAQAIREHGRVVRYPERWGLQAVKVAAFTDAARIARQGGRDE